jgi:hypothetical protein
MLNGHFDFNIPFIIFLEEFPFFRCVRRHISCSSTVGFCGFTWNTEVTDEVFAFFEFLLLKTKNSTYTFKGEWQPHVGRPYHRAFP